MSNIFLLAATLSAALTTAPASAQTSLIEQGRNKFDRTCAPCHGKGTLGDSTRLLPGTDALRIKYRGQKPPALEDRTDLPAPALAFFVRQGVFSMPGFRKTEITDQEIAAVAAYLAESAKHPDGPIQTGPNKVGR